MPFRTAAGGEEPAFRSGVGTATESTRTGRRSEWQRSCFSWRLMAES